MPVTITLPDDLGAKLQQTAVRQRMTLHDYVIQALAQEVNSIDDVLPTLEEIVSHVQKLGLRPDNIHPGTANLAQLLAERPAQPDFDLTAWQQEWAQIEDKMTQITRDNEIEEGVRG